MMSWLYTYKKYQTSSQDKKGPTLSNVALAAGHMGLKAALSNSSAKSSRCRFRLADCIEVSSIERSHASGVKAFRRVEVKENTSLLCKSFWNWTSTKSCKELADFIQIVQRQYCTSRIPRASSSLPQPKSIDQEKHRVTLSEEIPLTATKTAKPWNYWTSLTKWIFQETSVLQYHENELQHNHITAMNPVDIYI